jgi:hypothetical protein
MSDNMTRKAQTREQDIAVENGRCYCAEWAAKIGRKFPVFT